MSKKKSPLAALTRLAITGVGSAVAYWYWVRPWYRTWGATQAEVDRALPGDDLVPNPQISFTHAITIAAPVTRVWPWIVQMGKDRAGFYSYERIENAMGLDIHNANRIVPELQNLKVGDIFPLGPNNFGPLVAILEPDRVMVLHGDTRTDANATFPGIQPGFFMNVTWTFYVEPIADQASRLIERFKLDYNRSTQNTLYFGVFLEPGAFVMERKMLLGIKARAESQI
jgi:hypothetical protein